MTAPLGSKPSDTSTRVSPFSAYPQSAFDRGNLGLALIRKGELEAGLEVVKKTATIKNPSTQGDLAYALARAGRTQELRALLETMLVEVGRNKEFAVAVAIAYSNLGEKEHALEWLETAYSEHIPFLITANSDFAFDGIRSEPRFQALMKK